MSLLTPILPSDTEGVKWVKLQSWLQLAVDNAGISYTMSGFLTPILTSDTPGVKWAKLGAWMQLLAGNISGGGGTGNVRSGTAALAQNDTSKAIVFSTPFTGGGLPDVVPTIMAPAGGDIISCEPDYSTLTNAGVTVIFSAAIPAAGYKLSYVANKT